MSEPADPRAPATGDGRSRRRWPLVVGVLVVGVLAAGAVWWVRREPARPVTIDEAKRRTNPDATEPSAPTGAPAAGVYEYQGSGGEKLSVPPLSQSEGPTIPGTVEVLADGCWRFRIDFSTNHWQTATSCRRGADLVETDGETWQRWLVGPTAITNLTTSVCDPSMVLPADRTPGQTWPARCIATNDGIPGETVSAGDYRFVGHEDVEVGGAAVPTVHFVRERELSGTQQGKEQTDVWLTLDTGLTVRNRRSVEADADTIIGKTTYTEVGEFVLTSLTPH